jgi:TRAP-type C4-dicarboxylate transport system permease small subunit
VQAVSKSISFLRRVEDAILALLLGSMIVVAAVQVLLRNFFDSGLYWGDSMVRVAVLWVALVGAMVASRDDSHIRIDIAGRFLPERYKAYVSRVTHLFTAAILGLFAWASFEFVQYEYEDGAIAFASIPAWVCEAIMPIGSGIMALRYLLHVIKPP